MLDNLSSLSNIIFYLNIDITLFQRQLEIGIPKGIRTPVTAVKGRCPRPLDDRDNI